MTIIKIYNTVEGSFCYEHREEYSLNSMLDEVKTKPNKKSLKKAIQDEVDFTIKDNGATYYFKF